MTESQIFKTWMQTVPVAAVARECCLRDAVGDLRILVYVYGPFRCAARLYWKTLVKEFRDLDCLQ